METEVLGKCLSALLIAAVAACFFAANGMFYEALVVQLNEWADGQAAVASSASSFYR